VLKKSFKTGCSWKEQTSLSCLPTQIKAISFHGTNIHPKLSQRLHAVAVDFAVELAVQECNPFHNEPVALAP